MKKLYYKKGEEGGGGGGMVHPSPPMISDHLAFLPATLLTLTAALSPDDREVLAYLISCYAHHHHVTNNNNIIKRSKPALTQRCSNKSDYRIIKIKNDGSGKDHPALFNCECFRCYMSYWVRWDSSPNRHLIHDIIDSFEDHLLTTATTNNNKKNKKSNKNKNNRKTKGIALDDDDRLKNADEFSFEGSVSSTDSSFSMFQEHSSSSQNSSSEDNGSLRRLVNSISQKIWGVFV